MPEFQGGYDQEEFIDASSIGAGSTIVGQGGEVISGQENLQGGNLSGGSSNTTLVLGAGGQSGNITFNQGSPQDVALAAQTLHDSMLIAQGQNQGILDFVTRAQSDAANLAEESSATSSEQFGKLALILGGLGIVGMGVYFFAKRG